MKNNINNRKKLKNIIKDVLIDDQINISDKHDDIIIRCASDLLSNIKDYFDSETLQIEDLDKYYLFKMWDENSTIKEFFMNLEIKDNNYKMAKFLFFVRSMEEFINLEQDMIDIKMKQKAKNKFEHITSVTCIEYEIVLFNSKDTNKFDVGIESRIRSLENTRTVKVREDNSDEIIVDGYVFTANLIDIIKIYNNIGNELFTSNIRFGIKDTLDVDTEIRKTINERPEEFWFLNNGITMVISDNEFCLKYSNSIELNYGKNKTISVINGAQTITASAKYFYDHKQSIDRIKDATIKSKVILRLIHIKNINTRNKDIGEKEIDKISLSLNRQKPIEPEDIAYTTPFVYKFNTIRENNNNQFNFFLVRRGDTFKGGHTLVNFARATSAYLAQDPGNARAAGKKSILGIKTTDTEYGYTFENKRIFVPELLEKNNNLQDIFNKYYKPVNFAIDTERYYLKNSNKIKEKILHNEGISNDIKKKQIAILNYGKWHFIAYLIYFLNKYNCEDYSNFNFIFNKINEDIIDVIIVQFIRYFRDSVPKEKVDLDSNDFKKNDLYDNFKKSDESRQFNTFAEYYFCQNEYSKEIALTIKR